MPCAQDFLLDSEAEKEFLVVRSACLIIIGLGEVVMCMGQRNEVVLLSYLQTSS